MTTKIAFRIRQAVARVEERHMKPDETVLQADILLAAAAECDNEDELLEAIAHALKAAEQRGAERERERCARIAEETEDGIAVWPDGHDIATAIRNSTALSHEEPAP